MARRPTTRSMCAGLLVFSTSKNIAWRVAGRRRSGPAGGTRDRAAGPARSLVLLRDGNRRRRLQAPRDIRQGPMHLPEHVHDAAEGLGHRRALASQCIELALEGTMDPAKLAELPAEPLALLVPRFERTTQAVALLDQRRNHMAELVLAFSQPPGSPLRVVDGLDLTHLAWRLLVVSAGLRVRRGGLSGHLGCNGDELMRCAGHQRRPTAAAVDRRRVLGRFILDGAAPVEHHSDLRVTEVTIAEVLIDRRLRPRDNDEITRHAASVRFLRRGRGSDEV